MKWWMIVLVGVVVAGGGWLYKVATTPVPGTKVPELGREHIIAAEVLKTNYNSNPPTSGPHLSTWVKPGIYDTPQFEGELLHSLEHGYITISYNCNVHLQNQKSKIKDQKYISKIKKSSIFFNQVLAHEESSASTSSADVGTPKEATGSAINESDACKTLVKNLSELATKKKLWKLIVVPRPSLDTTIALTAWTYIDKFDPPASGFDTKRIEVFIDYHRDHGPEQTME